MQLIYFALSCAPPTHSVVTKCVPVSCVACVSRSDDLWQRGGGLTKGGEARHREPELDICE
eukprot:2807615-Pleurochrysis_carterae.AAC.3